MSELNWVVLTLLVGGWVWCSWGQDTGLFLWVAFYIFSPSMCHSSCPSKARGRHDWLTNGKLVLVQYSYWRIVTFGNGGRGRREQKGIVDAWWYCLAVSWLETLLRLHQSSSTWLSFLLSMNEWRWTENKTTLKAHASQQRGRVDALFVMHHRQTESLGGWEGDNPWW